jgi:hypothetical protein
VVASGIHPRATRWLAPAVAAILWAGSAAHAQAPANRPPTVLDTSPGTLDLELVNGDRWLAEILEAGPEVWRVRAASGIEWQVPVSAIRSFGYPENERLVFAFPDSAPDGASRGGVDGMVADPGLRTTVQIRTPPFLDEGRISFWWHASNAGTEPIRLTLWQSVRNWWYPRAGGAATEPIRLTLWLADRSGSAPTGAAPSSLRWILPAEGGLVLPEIGSGVDFARTPVPVEPGWHRFTWHARDGHVRVTVDDRVVAERTGELPRVGACRWEWSGGGPTPSVREIRVVRYQAPSSPPATEPGRDERQDAVLMHDGSTLYGRLGRAGAEGVRLVPFAGKDVLGKGEKLPWGDVRRVWRSGSAQKFPTTPWGAVTSLEWTGRDETGGATRQRWRVVTPTTSTGRETLAWHHPLLGRIELPPGRVVKTHAEFAHAEFDGALTWLGAPDFTFGRAGRLHAAWDVPFSPPDQAPKATATFVCEVRGLERSTSDATPLSNPLTVDRPFPPELPLFDQRPLTVRLGASLSPSHTNPRGLRLSVNGVTVGHLAEHLPSGAQRTHFSTVRIPIPQAALRASDNRLAVEFERVDPSALDLPRAGVPRAGRPEADVSRQRDMPVELRRALLEWRR